MLREARAAAALGRNDHIVSVSRVKDIPLGDGRHLLYLVMPLLQGETLQARIRRSWGLPLPIGEQRLIGQQIAKGLAAAHKAGLIHRDIKPANIWLDAHEEGVRVKILDFGLARSELDPHMTSSNTRMGTPAYMSPEQYHTSNVDPRADLWSLGVVLYQMATGRMPFEGETVFELMANIESREPIPVFRLNPQIPKEHADLIGNLLAKNPANRIGDAERIVEELKPIHVSQTTMTLETQWTIPAPKRHRRKVIIGSALMAVMLTIALVVWLNNRPGLPSSSEIAATRTEPVPPEPKVEPPLPVERPALLSGNQTNQQIATQRTAWARFYGVPERFTEVLGDGVQLEMVFVPPGKFWMGSPPAEVDRADMEIQHEVTISEGFYIGKYEVTQEQYKAVMSFNPSHFRAGGPGAEKVRDWKTNEFPVETVSWPSAHTFAENLRVQSERNGKKRWYRLPHEAEWEYACRGGACGRDSMPFHFEIGPQATLGSTEANFDGNFPYGEIGKDEYLERTARVGSYQRPNRFGLYDMHGNVNEWCDDWYGGNYFTNNPMIDPAGPEEGTLRVLRGGRWSSNGWGCRAADRGRFVPGSRSEFIGFRVVASLAEPK